ncbi:DNA polymerase III subunit tau [Gammaproteobacteria bacterium]
MSYQVLARKWRPKNFAEVIGQEHVLRALMNALTQNRLHHAYLFAGTRGVGKTTIARILAKCLNCETGIVATPCGKCDACVEIDVGRFIDLIEVDAASRTKVEDTRDLLDSVQYLPAKGRFKIYIIDEVHMLSGHSFNALLKTLEEPPEHVKFLLATTDPQKLPITVLSRCLQFNLKILSSQLLQKQLQHVLAEEKIEFESEACRKLALAADGSARDALSLLDQAIAFCQGRIVATDVNAMLGAIDTGKIFVLLEALLSNDAKAVLEVIAELAELAIDFTNAINDLLEIFQQIAVVQLVADVNTTNWQHQELIHKLAAQLKPEEVQLYYQIGLIGKRDLPLAPSLCLGFEMVMLRMLAFRLEADIVLPTSKVTVSMPAKPIINNAQTTLFTSKPMVATNPVVDNQNTDILKQLNVTGPTQALLRHCVITKIDQNEVELLLEAKQSLWLNKKHEERISQALSEHLKRPITVNIKLGTPAMDTVASVEKREALQKQTRALQSIEKDPKIKELMSRFGAKIISKPVKLEEQ